MVHALMANNIAASPVRWHQSNRKRLRAGFDICIWLYRLEPYVVLQGRANVGAGLACGEVGEKVGFGVDVGECGHKFSGAAAGNAVKGAVKPVSAEFEREVGASFCGLTWWLAC